VSPPDDGAPDDGGGGDDHAGAGPAAAGGSSDAAPAEIGADGAPTGRRRRRRRRRGEGGEPRDPGEAEAAPDAAVAASDDGHAGAPAPAPGEAAPAPRGARPGGDSRGPRPERPPGDRGPRPERPPGDRGPRPDRGQPAARTDDRGPRPDRGQPAARTDDRGPRPDRGQPADARGPRGDRPAGERGPRPERGQPADARGPRADRPAGERGPRPDRGQPAARTDDRGPRPDRPAGERGPRPERGVRADAPGPRPERGRGDRPRDAGADRARTPEAEADDLDQGWDAPAAGGFERKGAPAARVITPAADDDAADARPEPAAVPAEDDGPVTPITLAADLPADPPIDDLDPLTADLTTDDVAHLAADVANLVGVRLGGAGRVTLCDAGDASYGLGDQVVIDTERGPRLATVAIPSARRASRDKQLRRVLRRANPGDQVQEAQAAAGAQHVLRAAKDKAAQLRLPIKVFRAERAGGRVLIYFTSDERVDVREFLRDLGQVAGGKIELRQLGVRDEAKMVGGIGSCGQELCCTTWLPEFVPVSIKMAKDQGLVLNPTKVSGQCGRLKCCLVYEQATYAELRKGLPKLGKRVITPVGEGRVVEVDVLRQRIRVGYGPGDSQVHPAAEIKPMFPAQQGGRPAPDEPDEPDDPDPAGPADGNAPA
jgi:cell fate regulator YaaT (PSP1 superfamily)